MGFSALALGTPESSLALFLPWEDAAGRLQSAPQQRAHAGTLISAGLQDCEKQSLVDVSCLVYGTL